MSLVSVPGNGIVEIRKQNNKREGQKQQLRTYLNNIP
jgi:hypothetical protein